MLPGPLSSRPYREREPQYSGSVAFRAARFAVVHAVALQLLPQNLRCLFRFFGKGSPHLWQASAE